MSRSNQQIKSAIIDQLKWDSRVDITNIDLEVSGGIVRLKGFVPSNRMREIVEMDALEVEGVTDLVNELEIQYDSTAVLPADEQVKDNIEKMFSWDPDIESNNIERR